MSLLNWGSYWPKWVGGTPGSRLWAVTRGLLSELERVALWARYGLYSRWISTATSRQVTIFGQQRMLTQQVGETPDAYARRVLSAWSFYEGLGTARATREAFALLGYTVEVIAAKDFGLNPPDGNPDFWNRIWLQIEVPFEIPFWDSPGHHWDYPTQTWDGGLLPGQIDQWIELVQTTKAAYNLFVGFILITPTTAVYLPVAADKGR